MNIAPLSWDRQTGYVAAVRTALTPENGPREKPDFVK
jgi:hypothetical protein